ncbi:MAG: OadG family protein [Kiritimatiellae bacterium]|nr:OadG family protein [Kiritimatiellia bacterium]
MEILSQGLVLLIAGMSIVFLFLAMLVFVMTATSKFIPKFNHILPDDKPRKRPTKSAASDDTAIAIAIAVAASQTA